MRKRFLFIFLAFLWLLTSCSHESAPVPLPEIGYDDDGMITKKGKRIFILGTYYLPQGEDSYHLAAQCGYNLVRVAENRSELDQAHAQGLDAWISIGSVESANFAAAKSRYAERINKLKDHPALLFWEMEDEPAWRWNLADCRISAEDLRKSYQVIKENDAKHLVYTNHAPTNLISTLQRYNTATDIVACDIYPIIPRGIRLTYALFPDGMQGDLLNTYPSQVGEYTDKMRQVAGQGRPLFMVLQGFAWEMLRKEGDRDSQMIQYPSYHETRFMAIQAIIHGANGLIYWGTGYTPQPSPFWSDLTAVTRELAALQPVLASRSVAMTLKKEYLEVGHSADAGVEIAVKTVDGNTFLLAVNADKNPVHLKLSGLQPFRSATVLTENRKVSIDDGTLVELFTPFATHIYRLEKY